METNNVHVQVRAKAKALITAFAQLAANTDGWLKTERDD